MRMPLAMPGLLRRAPLARNVVASVGLTILNGLAAVVTVPVTIAALGYGKYGLWAATTGVLALIRLGAVGVSPAVVKAVAESHAAGDERGVRAVATAGMVLTALVGICLVSFPFVAAHFVVSLIGVRGPDQAEAVALVRIVGVVTVLTLVANTSNSVVTGLGRLDRASWEQGMSRVISLVVQCALLLEGFRMSALIAGVVVNGVVLWLWSLHTARVLTGHWPITLSPAVIPCLKRIGGIGAGVTGASVFMLLVDPLNKTILARFAGLESVSAYDIALTLGTQLRQLAQAAMIALLPEFSRMRPNGAGHQAASRLESRATVAAVLWGTATVVGVLALGRPVLQLWLGARFLPVLTSAVTIMVAAGAFGVAGAPAYYRLVSIGDSAGVVRSAILHCATHAVVLGGWFLGGGKMSVNVACAGVLCASAVSLAYVIVRSRSRCRQIRHAYVVADSLYTA